jgi:hypothetical protein
MRYLVIVLLQLTAVSCKQEFNENREATQDNKELTEIYNADQADRQKQPIDWNNVSKRDSSRKARVLELLDSNKLRTSSDYHNAAMIFQHGMDSVSYGMAVKLMRKSIELDPTADKWLLAAAIDRYLLSTNKPQIYGTQYWKIKDQPWELREIDTTKITDAVRIEYGVETLAQQRERLRQMNSK